MGWLGNLLYIRGLRRCPFAKQIQALQASSCQGMADVSTCSPMYICKSMRKDTPGIHGFIKVILFGKPVICAKSPKPTGVCSFWDLLEVTGRVSFEKVR